MPIIFPILAGGLLVGGTAAAVKYYNSDADEEFDAKVGNNRDTNNSLVAENNENEKEGGQRNFGDDYKQQELYYASDEYKETLEPYEKSSSGNKVNSDNAAKSKKLTEEVKKQNRKRLSKYNQRRQGGVLRYPLESLTEHTDYLQIDIEKYVPIGSGYASAPGEANRYVTGNYFTTNRAGRRSASKLSTKPLINAGTILLPIPASLQDTNNVRYDSSNLNGLAAAGVELAESGMRAIDFTKPVQQQADALRDAAGGFKGRVVEGVGSPSAAKDIIIKSLASAAVNQFGANTNFNQLLARSTGEILNPNMELLFGGPTLRNFRFQFKFTPRNEKEAEQVRLIIRAFKRNMAPQAQGGQLNSGNWFLKTPNVFKLRYRTGRNDHPFLNKFKQCFLSDVQTTYTADGVYSTYDDGTPVSMTLDLSFKEIQPIYDIDYDARPGTQAVGY
tara:strand:+ start:396 stop:1730 length:1335 start_codon:yes stop_codon:yes gene_type:complete